MLNIVTKITLSTILVFSLIACKKTEVPQKVASVSLGEITFTSNTARVEINITDDGNASIMEAGIYFKSTAGAINGGTRITTTPNKGKFFIELTGLKKATNYFLVGYVANTIGTTYTQEISFNTSPELPTISNQNVNLEDPITANYNYNISDNGGAALSARGICWNTTGSPTISDNKKVDTILTGSVSNRIFDLKPNTKYFFRMFATNSVGTVYTSEISYTTNKLNSCFPNPLILNSNVSEIEIQNDGKILIGGSFSEINRKEHTSLVRINKDGTIDNTFNFLLDNSIYDRNIYDLKLQGDKIILLIKSVSSSQFSIIRLNSNGSIDKTFYTGLPSSGYTVNNIEILPNGKIIIVGGLTVYNGLAVKGIVCLNSDGTVDSNFNTGTGFDIRPNQVLALPTGKIIIGGSFSTYNGRPVSNLIRLNADGSIDETFISNITNNTVGSISYNSSINKIYINYFSSASFGNFVRLNLDGSQDNTFAAGSLSPNSGNSKAISNIVYQQDGKIIVHGSYVAYNGIGFTNNLVRLNSDGKIDNTFDIGKGFSNNFTPSGTYTSPFALKILDDKSVLFGGSFGSYDGGTVKFLTKLNESFTTCGN
jgi:uncharacterized delta-60 repeat protein